MNYITIDNILLKKYDDTYYISQNGDVYSTHSKKFLKHDVKSCNYPRVDIHSKHKSIHRLVYTT